MNAVIAEQHRQSFGVPSQPGFQRNLLFIDAFRQEMNRQPGAGIRRIQRLDLTAHPIRAGIRLRKPQLRERFRERDAEPVARHRFRTEPERHASLCVFLPRVRAEIHIAICIRFGALVLRRVPPVFQSKLHMVGDIFRRPDFGLRRFLRGRIFRGRFRCRFRG